MEPCGCNRRSQIARARSGGNKRKPFPWVASDCRLERMVSRASAVGCDPLRESPPSEGGGRLRGAGLGERDVVAAADRAALDDVGIDTDIRFVVLRCGAQDAGVFG
jgi:hypothetical protein